MYETCRAALRARYGLSAVLAIAAAVAAPSGHANTASRANPTTGTFASEIYWMDWTGLNATLSTGSGTQAYSFSLADGSTLSLNLTRGGASTATVAATVIPTFSGAAMGNAGYCFVLPCGTTAGVPKVALYSSTAIGSNISFELSNIVLTNPAGNAVQNFEIVMADAESMDTGDGTGANITFTTTGGNWNEIERVPATGRAAVALSGVGTQSVTQPAGASPVPAWVLTTANPATGVFNATAAITSTQKQGVMLGLRFGSISLTKNIAARSNPADQFVYRINNAIGVSIGAGSGACATVGDCTTSGATTGNQITISAAVTTGNTVTLQEAMAAGSVNPLSAYTSTVHCTNANAGSSTVLPPDGPYNAASPPQINLTSANDNIACVITNSAAADMTATAPATAAATTGVPVTISSSCGNAGPNVASAATCTVSGIPATATNISTMCTPTPPTSLAPGNSIACTTTFTPNTPGTVSVTTTAASATPDPNPGNEVKTTTLTIVTPASLGVSKTSNGPWSVGQTAPAPTYTLTANNTGGTATAGVITIRDTLPTGISAVSGAYNGWNCSVSGQSLSCTNSLTLAANTGTTALTVPVTIAAAAVASGITANVTNQAAIGGGGDPNNGGTPPTPGSCAIGDAHCGSTTTTVNTPAAITVAKTQISPAAGTRVQQGSVIAYSLVASNTGGTAAVNAAFYEEIPANTTASFPSALSGATSDCTGTVNGPALCKITFATVAAATSPAAPGAASASLSVTVATLPGNAAGILNLVTDDTTTKPSGCVAANTSPGACTGTPPTTCMAGDTHCVATPVIHADLIATGSSTVTATQGVPVTVTTTCTNNGPDAATNASCAVTSSISGLTLTTVCTPASPDANLSAAPGSNTLTCQTTFTATAPGTITLTTTASSSTNDPTPGNNTAPSTVNVLPPAPLANPDENKTPYASPLSGSSILGNDSGTGIGLQSVNSTNCANGCTLTTPAGGTLVVNADGTYTYTPPVNFSGDDTIPYAIVDSSGRTASTVLTIHVGPKANDDSANTASNTPVSVPTVGNDHKPSTSTCVLSTQPVSGTATIDPSTCIVTYTPSANTPAGSQTMQYQVCDSYSQCSTATVTVTVAAPNAPVANPDVNQTPFATPLTGITSILANDTGTSIGLQNVNSTACGSGCTVTTPAGGTLIVASDGTYTYTPPANFSGDDTIPYTILDGSGQSSTSALTIHVGPQANPDTTNTPYNTPVVVTTSSNDYKPASSTCVLLAPQPSSGTATIDPVSCAVTYMPTTATPAGPQSVQYRICDAFGQCSTTSVTVNVGAQNAPVASPDVNHTPFATPITAGPSILGNDSGSGIGLQTVNGQSCAGGCTLTTSAGGTLVVNADRTYSYTPAATFSGDDTIPYTIVDKDGNTANATLTIHVGPQANDDTGSAPYNTPVTVQTSGNDAKPVNSNCTLTAQPTSGTATIDATTCAVTYTPTATTPGGPQTMTYEVCDSSAQCSTATVTISVAAPSGPVANPDQNETAFDTPLNGSTSVLANDAGTSITLQTVGGTPCTSGCTLTTPAGGSLTVKSDGTYTYSPPAGFSGTDTIAYTIVDAVGQTATATLTIAVGPNAVDDTFSTAVNTPLSGSVTGGDSYPPGATFSSVANPAHGGVVVNPDGTFTYTPTTNYSGTDSFTYEVCSPPPNQTLCSMATVSLTVSAGSVTALPDIATTAYGTPVTTHVTGNDLSSGAPLNQTVTPSQPAHGSVACDNAGNCTYTPAAGFSGSDVYTYRVCDQTTPTASCASTSVTVTVGPLAAPQTVTTSQGTAVSGSVAAGGSYPPGSSFSLTSNPAHGTVTMNPDGSFTYTPASGYSGLDSFTFSVCEPSPNQSQCSIATVTIHVTPPELPAVAVPVNERWMLALIALMMAAMGIYASRRPRLRG